MLDIAFTLQAEREDSAAAPRPSTTVQPSKLWNSTLDQFKPRRGKNDSELGPTLEAVPLGVEGKADAPLYHGFRLWELVTASDCCSTQRSCVQ